MMHAWISTDGPGVQCWRCGVAMDYDTDSRAQADAARGLIGWCDVAYDPDSRPHHFVLIGADDDYGYALDCAYDSVQIRSTVPYVAHHGCTAR